MISCVTCRYFKPATHPSEAGPGDYPMCNWAPFESYPLWVDAVGHWMMQSDIDEAEGECPAWRAIP